MHTFLQNKRSLFFLLTLSAYLLIFIPYATLANESSQPEYIESEHPKWLFLRYQEDWSSLKKSSANPHLPIREHIKFIPLNNDASYWASFGGHMRARVENWSNFSFAAPPEHNDTFFLWRFTGHSDIHWGKTLRTFIEVKSALASNRKLPGAKRTLDVDTLALQQAFIDLKYAIANDITLTLRPGRQELLFGKQRLVSPLPWGNTLRSWDGISAIIQSREWHVTGFWSQFAPVDKYGFNDTDSNNTLFGLYADHKLSHSNIDLYWLGLDRKKPSFNSITGTELRHTLGVRLSGKLQNVPVDYDIETAYQFGHIGATNITAYMLATQAGHTLYQRKGQPRLYLGFDYASGDDASSSDIETFNQLFPLGHAYVGFIDLVGRQNIIDFSQGISLKPHARTIFKADSHVFWRASDQDALYNPGGSSVRLGNGNLSSSVGNEIDFTVKYTVDRYLVTQIGYSHFFAGNFIRETGQDEGIDFIHIQAQYTF